LKTSSNRPLGVWETIRQDLKRKKLGYFKKYQLISSYAVEVLLPITTVNLMMNKISMYGVAASELAYYKAKQAKNTLK
jgi:hypothetical protein